MSSLDHQRAMHRILHLGFFPNNHYHRHHHLHRPCPCPCPCPCPPHVQSHPTQSNQQVLKHQLLPTFGTLVLWLRLH